MDRDRDAEALRRRLYQADASSADVTSYRVLVAEDVPAAPRPEGSAAPPDEPPNHRADPPVTRRRTSLTLLAVLGTAVVLGGAAVAVGRIAPPPSTAPTAPAWTSAPRDPGDSMVALAVVDEGRRPHATGPAEPAGAFSSDYTVAPGDTVQGIANRFGLCSADVLLALPNGVDASRLPPGRRILLLRASAAPSRAGARSC